MDVQEWPLSEVTPYEGNPRHVSQMGVDAVAESLSMFGWRQPLVVDADGVIVVGHTRFLAAQQLGMATVPVHVADGLSDAEAAAYRLIDNKTGEYTEWDPARVQAELAELADGLEPFEPPEGSPIWDALADIATIEADKAWGGSTLSLKLGTSLKRQWADEDEEWFTAEEAAFEGNIMEEMWRRIREN